MFTWQLARLELVYIIQQTYVIGHALYKYGCIAHILHVGWTAQSSHFHQQSWRWTKDHFCKKSLRLEHLYWRYSKEYKDSFFLNWTLWILSTTITFDNIVTLSSCHVSSLSRSCRVSIIACTVACVVCCAMGIEWCGAVWEAEADSQRRWLWEIMIYAWAESHRLSFVVPVWTCLIKADRTQKKTASTQCKMIKYVKIFKWNNVFSTHIIIIVNQWIFVYFRHGKTQANRI